MSNNATPSEEKWRRRTPQQSASPSLGQQQNHRGQSQRGNFQGQGSYRGGGSWGNSSPAPHGSPHGQGHAAFFEEHVPVRNFNSREVEEYLQKGYNQVLMEAQNPQVEQSKKPLLYKLADTPVPATKPTGGAWGLKPMSMANGTDFIAQLRKGATKAQQPA